MMSKSKDRYGGRTTRLVLGLVLIGALLTSAGLAFAADPQVRPRADCQPPPEVIEKSNLVFDNHIQLLSLHLQCAQTIDAIRHKIQALRGSGIEIPEETRAALKASREAVHASMEALRATRPLMQAEHEALHEARQARDWPAVIEHLENILALQVTRLEEVGHVLAQLQNILSLLESLG